MSNLEEIKGKEEGVSKKNIPGITYNAKTWFFNKLRNTENTQLK